jgi:hypothetical protein
MRVTHRDVRDTVGYVMVFLATLALLLLFSYRISRAHDNEFYSTWMMPPDREASCCSDKDCYHTQVKKFGATWFALRREDQVWVPVPDNKIEQNQQYPVESPDGLSHVCMSPPENGTNVYCVTLGSGG